MNRKIKKYVSMLLAVVLSFVCIGNNYVFAAQNTNFQVGQNSKKIPITSSVSATIKIHANTADGGRQEYVEGSISYGYKKKLGVAVEGYYFKDGVMQKIYAQGSSTGCNYQKKLPLSNYGKAVCNKDYKSLLRTSIDSQILPVITFPS